MDTDSSLRVATTAISPISNLPPELFLSIALFCVLGDPPRSPNAGPSSAQSLKGSLGWIYVTHVCHSWRHICIHTPSLWTHWVGRLPRSLPIILSRAGSHLPLKIDMDSIQRSWEVSNGINWQHLLNPRTESAMLVVHDWTDLTDLERLLISSGLTVCNLRYLTMNALTFSTRIPPLAVHFPALQSAYLCRYTFASLTAPRLTKLTLEHYPLMLTPHSLYELLDSCTALIHLSFVKCELGVLRGSLPTSRIKLDHLRTLELIECEVIQGQGWVSIADLFMHQTSLPPSASVRVVFCKSISNNDAIESIRFCFGATSRKPSNPSDTLIIRSNGVDIVRRSPSCSIDDDTWFHFALPGTERCAMVDFAESDAVYLAAFSASRLPDAQLRFITVLSLHWENDGNVFMMPNIDSLFVKLDCLRILRVQARLIFHDILCHLSSETLDGRWLPNMPHLEHLWLDGRCYKGNVKHATENLLSLAKVIRGYRYTELSSGFLVSPRVLYLQDFGTSLPDDACIAKFRDMGIEVIMAKKTAN